MIFHEILQLRTEDDEMFIAKKIAIQDLPDCYAKEKLMQIADPTETIWVVGKPGSAGDWAAYTGHPVLMAFEESRRPHFALYVPQGLHLPHGTLAHGDKMEGEAAAELFPEFSELKYRR